jgi:hypothetical protein
MDFKTSRQNVVRLTLYVLAAVSLCSLAMSLIAIALVNPLIQTRLGSEEPDALTRTDQAELSDCIARALRQTKRDALVVSLDDYERVTNFCGHVTYALNKLAGMDVTTETFRRQLFDTRLILFMVLILTLSGVGLATIQLLASYKLASAGHGNALEAQSEITLEKNKVSLKSSVTGLIILVVSLAFFIVYVKWVYPITPVSMGDSPQQQMIMPLPSPLQGQYAPAVQSPTSSVNDSTSLGKANSMAVESPDSTNRHKNVGSAEKK